MIQYQLHMTRGQPDDEAIRLLRNYEGYVTERFDPRGYCICSSEGKDSRVLGHLARRAGVRHFYLHNVTGLDPPELVYFQRHAFQEYRDMGYQTIDSMYELSMWQLMQRKLIPPLRQKRYCCEHLKERKVLEQGDACICTGVRAAESIRRKKMRGMVEGRRTAASRWEVLDPDEPLLEWSPLTPYVNDDISTVTDCYTHNVFTINPIVDWSTADIWNYSQEAKLGQCSLYAEGFARLGCVGCPMAGARGRQQEFERWPKFRALWLRAFKKTLALRRERGLKILHYATNAEDWFDWWLSDRAQDEPPDEDQLHMEGFYASNTA